MNIINHLISTIKQYSPKENAIGAILSNISESGIFAGSIELNRKRERFYPLATVGSIVPVVYETSEQMQAFTNYICEAICKGYDTEYLPAIRLSKDFSGGRTLVYSNIEQEFSGNTERLPIPLVTDYISFSELIRQQSEELEAQILIFEDATQILSQNCNSTIAHLVNAANEQGLIIFLGIKASKEENEINEYLTNHAYNLCTLSEESMHLESLDGVPEKKKYLLFQYGGYNPHSIAYVYDGKGSLCYAMDLTRMVRAIKYCNIFAKTQITQQDLINRIFGYLQGEFQISTIENDIALAERYGILLKAGRGRKSNYILNGTLTNEFVNKEKASAIKANGDPTSRKTGYTKRKRTIAEFGELKLIIPKGDCPEDVVIFFTSYLSKAVVWQKPFLGFTAKSTRRDTLVFIISSDTFNEQRAQKYIDFMQKPNDGASLKVVCTQKDTTDKDFLELFRSNTNTGKWDYVFVIGFNNIEYSIYDPSSLVKEIGITAKQYNFVCITQTYNCDRKSLQNLREDKIWSIEPFINYKDLCYINNSMDKNIKQIFLFRGIEHNYPFLSRFWGFCKSLTKKEYNKAALTKPFYTCDRTRRKEVQASDSKIKEAEKAGIIRVIHTTTGCKNYDDAVITFKGKL